MAEKPYFCRRDNIGTGAFFIRSNFLAARKATFDAEHVDTRTSCSNTRCQIFRVLSRSKDRPSVFGELDPAVSSIFPFSRKETAFPACLVVLAICATSDRHRDETGGWLILPAFDGYKRFSQ